MGADAHERIDVAVGELVLSRAHDPVLDISVRCRESDRRADGKHDGAGRERILLVDLGAARRDPRA
jgi:hypothetical protein